MPIPASTSGCKLAGGVGAGDEKLEVLLAVLVDGVLDFLEADLVVVADLNYHL